MKILNFSAIVCVIFGFVTSCAEKEIKSTKGGIDIISNIYIDASKGLENIQNYHISKINYSNDTIIELIPDIDNPLITDETYYIKDTIFYPFAHSGNTISDLVKTMKPQSVYSQKQKGAVFMKRGIVNYHHRKNLTDTILFGKNYARFEVNSPQTYSRYYVYKTDTILPYTIYPHAGKDYKGRIERIDTYDKQQDTFITLQMIPRKKWDDEAKDIFEYSQFVQNKTKK